MRYLPLRLSIAYNLLPYGIVVELSPVRGLVAGYLLFDDYSAHRNSLCKSISAAALAAQASSKHEKVPK